MKETELQAISYSHPTDAPEHTSAYVWGPVMDLLAAQPAKRVFDVGCGNGSFARHLKKNGYEVSGIDISKQGIAQANKTDPSMKLEIGSAYDPLVERFGTFPVVVSLEIVSHLYAPRDFARTVADLLEPNGMAIITTPYHGYLKNLVLALTGKMDAHFNALWDHGTIKFWSVATLTTLFEEVGLQREHVRRAGRVAALAKSMILAFRKPRGPST